MKKARKQIIREFKWPFGCIINHNWIRYSLWSQLTSLAAASTISETVSGRCLSTSKVIQRERERVQPICKKIDARTKPEACRSIMLTNFGSHKLTFCLKDANSTTLYFANWERRPSKYWKYCSFVKELTHIGVKIQFNRCLGCIFSPANQKGNCLKHRIIGSP